MDKLNRRIAEHPSVGDLPDRYDLMIRGIKSDIDIFREENIPLGVEQTKLVTKAHGNYWRYDCISEEKKELSQK